MVLPLFAQSQATLTTDQTDYYPGTIVTFFGSGFDPFETVTMDVNHLDGTPADAYDSWEVTADATGGFTTTWQLCEEECVGE
ncbi:MAG TPA: hypothetical protein VGK46_01735 [Saprospiraceae bacterium]